MNAPSSIAEARWDRIEDVNAHKPIDMVRIALSRMERGEINPDHAILCMCELSDDGSVSSEWLQAGSLNPFGQLGLLERVKAALFVSKE